MSNQNNRATNGREDPPEPSRKTVQIAIVIMAVAALGAFLLFKPKGPEAATNTETNPPTVAVKSPAPPSSNTGGGTWTPPKPPPVTVSDPVVPTMPPPTNVLVPVPAPPATPETTMASEAVRKQLTDLAQLDLTQGEVSADKLTAAAQSLQGILAQGQSAFVSATSQMSPAEIERLTLNMSALAPDQFRPFAVAAASAALNAATQSQNKEDVGALFRVLEEHGGPEVAPQLESMAQNWKYYSTIALANLPDGAGVPSLIRMIGDANNPSPSSRNAALQALAQVAPTSPEAMAVLQDQAKANTIPFTTWINIASGTGRT